MNYRVEARNDEPSFRWYVIGPDGYQARFIEEEPAREWADFKNFNEEVNE